LSITIAVGDAITNTIVIPLQPRNDKICSVAQFLYSSCF